MRLQACLGLALCLALPAALAAKAYNEMSVEKLNGTVMIQHADGSDPTALQTGSTVQKGDTLTVFDKSWVILKSHRGDRIGFDGDKGPTVVFVDEFFIEGPDRQIRFLLQKGTLFLKTNGCGSRQSFFEINAGSVVTSINNTRAILNFDPGQNQLKVQYLDGKMTVLDKNSEQVMSELHTEHQWKDGVLQDKGQEQGPEYMDELDSVNFSRFFDGETRLQPESNNILLTK